MTPVESRQYPRRTLFRAALAAALFSFALGRAEAQFSNHEWLNFEDGAVPKDAIRISGYPDQALAAVRIADVPGMDPSFKSAASARETGQYALAITATPDVHNHLSFTNGLAASQLLDRDKIGAAGRAVYQTDFYLPGPGEPLPSLAVVAIEDQSASPGKVLSHVTKPFYRFGLTLGKTLYFSCVLPGEKTAAVYKYDNDLMQQIPRPGWHRFSIVMEGPETIRLYVDGREPHFSPVKEATLRQLIVGVLVADKERSYTAYCDNISIQISQDSQTLPASPYQDGWAVARSASAGASKQAPAPVTDAALAAGSAAWLEPLAAWETAKRDQKPMLLYFYAPDLPATVKMEGIFASDPRAREFLQRHSNARIDVNQLQGGAIARQYGVFKAPTLLVIAPDGVTHRRAMPSASDSWSLIAPQLSLQ